MPTFALVEPTGRVAQVEEHVFDVAKPYVWIECDSAVNGTYTYQDGKFVPPPKDKAK